MPRKRHSRRSPGHDHYSLTAIGWAPRDPHIQIPAVGPGRRRNGVSRVGIRPLSSTPYGTGSYDEQISPGAFASLSSRPDVQLLVNHEGVPLARTTNGSLMLREDDKGLRFDAQLDRDDPDAQLVHRKISSGLLDQCSFAFTVTDQDWNSDRTLRTISGVNLDRGDVSIVNYGASPTTSVDARAIARLRKESNLSLYQARARARHLRILNNAGRRR